MDKYDVYKMLMDEKLILNEPAFNPDAYPILEKRYLMDKDDGTKESISDMLWRVASWVAKEDFNYDKEGISYDKIKDTAIEFYNVMANGYFLPNSPTLRGAGRESGNLSGCFAIGIDDSRESIFNALKLACEIGAYGGGVGSNFSAIRPKGDVVTSTGGKASGPISFMKIFDLAYGEVIEQGGVRASASIGILHYTHPDIMDFIKCKRDKVLNNFNISVGVDKHFFDMARDNQEYALINPRNNEVWGKINAKDVLDAIIDNIWSHGEPGLLFMDRIEESNPTPELGKLDHVNPCLSGDCVVNLDKGNFMIKDIPVETPITFKDADGTLMYSPHGFYPTGKQDVYELTLYDEKDLNSNDGIKIKATANHLFYKHYTNTKEYYQWVELRKLKRGDLLVMDGKDGWIKSIKKCGIEDVYDISIPGRNWFYANGVKVHNCGEVSLLVGKEGGESCNLGSINLAKMIYDDGTLLMNTVNTAIHFLDNVIDANVYVHPEIEELTKGNRKIGLGIMGFADAIAHMGIPYGSEECITQIDHIMSSINDYVMSAEERLARNRGSFPNYDKSIYKDTGYLVRNASSTLIAPTGTLSTLLGVTGGIEPFYAMSYKRGTLYKDGKPTEYIDVINPQLHDILYDISGDIGEDLRPLVKGKASIQDIQVIPDDIRKTFLTAHDIDPITHIKVQDAFQKWLDNNISKTVNLSNCATKEDVANAIWYAVDNTCVRGLTMYRDGCREHQVLSSGMESSATDKTIKATSDIQHRSSVLKGDTIKVNTPLGSLYVTINADESGIQEVFLNISKSGNDVKADAEALGRAVTFLFRAGYDIAFVINQFRHIGGSGSVGFGENRVASLPDGLALALEIYNNKGQDAHDTKRVASIDTIHSGSYCPVCGMALIRTEKCLKCISCDFSKC
jgi:ribonucleoside-diphosphate reductase alpha chain